MDANPLPTTSSGAELAFLQVAPALRNARFGQSGDQVAGLQLPHADPLSGGPRLSLKLGAASPLIDDAGSRTQEGHDCRGGAPSHKSLLPAVATPVPIHPRRLMSEIRP